MPTWVTIEQFRLIMIVLQVLLYVWIKLCCIDTLSFFFITIIPVGSAYSIDLSLYDKSSLTLCVSRPDRLKDIADRFNLDQSAMLDNVLYARAYTSK